VGIGAWGGDPDDNQSSGAVAEDRVKTEASRLQHRAMEQSLDELFAAIHSRSEFLEHLRRAQRLAEQHYAAEEGLLAEIAKHEPAVAEKLAAQHAEALEMAAGVEQAASAGQGSDARQLAKRFHAIAQHNIIEEERDVFPLAEAWG
jgi:hypothetical protein